MYKNIIVGVAGHDGGRDAIALAQRLGGPGGRLTLAHAYPAGIPPWSVPAEGSEEHEASHALLAHARETVAPDADTVSLAAPSPGRALHDLADRIGADLIVIGSSRESLLGRVLVGDHLRAALNGAPCAVAVAPAGFAQRANAVTTVGVGYDGTPEADHVLAVARELADDLHARLSALEVIPLPGRFTVGPAWPDHQTVETMLDQARTRLAALGDLEPAAAWGDAAEELATYSSTLGLLVIGSRGYGPLGRLVHGSTSRRLARIARCPLLVLTRAAATAGREPRAPGARQSEQPVAGVS